MERELPLSCCKLMMQPKFRVEYAFSMAATGRLYPLSGQKPRSPGWAGDLDSEIGTLLVLPAANNGSLR